MHHENAPRMRYLGSRGIGSKENQFALFDHRSAPPERHTTFTSTLAETTTFAMNPVDKAFCVPLLELLSTRGG